MQVVAPRRASSSAVTAPMPEVAPVTRHTLPLMLRSVATTITSSPLGLSTTVEGNRATAGWPGRGERGPANPGPSVLRSGKLGGGLISRQTTGEEQSMDITRRRFLEATALGAA